MKTPPPRKPQANMDGKLHLNTDMVKPLSRERERDDCLVAIGEIGCDVAKDPWSCQFYSLVSGRGRFSSLSAIV